MNYKEQIKSYGYLIQSMHIPNFNVWAWIQTQINKRTHIEAIFETLEGAARNGHLKQAKNPFAYLNAIIKTKSQNVRERGFIKEHMIEKDEWNKWVEKLKRMKNGM